MKKCGIVFKLFTILFVMGEDKTSFIGMPSEKKCFPSFCFEVGVNTCFPSGIFVKLDHGFSALSFKQKALDYYYEALIIMYGTPYRKMPTRVDIIQHDTNWASCTIDLFYISCGNLRFQWLIFQSLMKKFCQVNPTNFG